MQDFSRIIRVFPTKTNMSPLDKMSYFGEPPMFLPEHDQVHISVTFTWDIQRAEYLRNQWSNATNKKILLGGPAYGDPGIDFTPGMYLKNGVTITSRGCNKKCSFCFVNKREGKIRELPIIAGNIIQDNNLLACSPHHIEAVFEMLKKQRKIQFTGGLDSKYITEDIAKKLSELSIYQLWLANDDKYDWDPLVNAIEILKPYFTAEKLRVYVLVGFDGDTMFEAEQRLIKTFQLGTKPFAMLYRDSDSTNYTKKRIQWRKFLHKWCRPAAFNTFMKHQYNPETYNEQTFQFNKQ